MDWKGKRALVVGCGFGEDALFLSKIGAEVFAFDLSPDLLQVARDRAAKEGLSIHFGQMAAEELDYPNDFFDLIFVRDILHHCDIPQSLTELARVSKPDTFVVVNEMYTHSFLQRIRNSRIVTKWFYPRIVNIIYQGKKPYITADERKLTEHDAKLLKHYFRSSQCDYFNFFVNRIVPEYEFLCKVDRILLNLLRPISNILGGRLVMTGNFRK